MDLGTIRELVRMLETSDVTEMEVEEDNLRVRLSKARPAEQMPAGMPVYVSQSGPALLPEGGAPVADTPVPAPLQEAPAESPAPVDDGLVTVNSPMVGTFYTSPAPGEPPFVLPGATVEAEQTVCIVEAMKIMNEVAAKQAGVIERVLVENGEAVEFDQPLFAVRPL